MDTSSYFEFVIPVNAASENRIPAFVSTAFLEVS